MKVLEEKKSRVTDRSDIDQKNSIDGSFVNTTLLDIHLEYWIQKLAGAPVHLALPTDYSRSSNRSYQSACHYFEFDSGVAKQLKQLALGQECTLYVMLLTLIKTLMYRYTQQRDISVGCPAASLQEVISEPFNSRFINTLVLRDFINEDQSFSVLLDQVKNTCLEAKENQGQNLEKIVEALRLQNLSVSQMFQVMLTLREVEQASSESIEVGSFEKNRNKLDLMFEFTESESGLTGFIEYSTEIFKLTTIERLTEHFLILCQSVIANKDRRVKDLTYINKAEQLQLKYFFNQTQAEYAKTSCIHQLIFGEADFQADKTAVIFGEDSLTYRQLEESSYRVAMYLQSMGIQPNDLVAIYFEPSLDMLVGLLGILRSGAAYVPLDPSYPQTRLRYILNDSKATIILSQEKLEHSLQQFSEGNFSLVSLDRQWTEIENECKALKARGVQLQESVTSDDLAYVIYTSGSTGNPKGVMLEHHSVVNLLQSMEDQLGFSPEDKLLSITTYCFDMSVLELFLPLIEHAQLCIASDSERRDGEQLKQLAVTYRPSVLQATPATWKMLNYSGYTPDKNLKILCGGEPLPESLRKFFLASGASAWNMFGPTETTIYSSGQRIGRGQEGIGKPIANTQIYIFDKYQKLQAIGIPGELHIAGEGLARGYINRPDLTDEKFVDNPFSPGTSMFKTGDLARWLEDGTLEYLGRIDTQVKIRGFRIELGEIETCLRQQSEVKDAVVTAMGEGDNRQLVGFYLAEATRESKRIQLDKLILDQHLSETLPDYMVPAAYISLSSIPLTPNGKVDRRKLQQYELTNESSQPYHAARTDIEKQLVAIWAEMFDIDEGKVGIHYNFFDVGGHSLLAVKFIGIVNVVFDRQLPVTILFTMSSIAQIAELITSKKTVAFEILVPIQVLGNNIPIFVVPGAGGNVLNLMPLATALGNEQPVYGLQAVGLGGEAAPIDNVEEIAAMNIAAIKKIQPKGPYRLLGYSNGGIIAFEMAWTLINTGYEIDSLILFDSYVPSLYRSMLGASQADMMYYVCKTSAILFKVDINFDIKLFESVPESQLIAFASKIMTDHGLDMPEEQFRALFGVFYANLQAVKGFEPKPILKEMNIALFCPDGKPYIDNAPSDHGWNDYIANEIRIFIGDGDHFSMFEEEYIAGYVDKLALCFE